MKTLLLIVLTFLSLPFVAQELERNCLLVAIFEVKEEGKSWMCRDYTYITEKVLDEAEYEILSKDYQAKYGDLYLSLKFVSSTQSCIIYEYQKEISGWDCTKKVISSVVESNIEKCNEEINRRYTSNIASYKTAPSEVFSWTGNGVAVAEPTKTVVSDLKTVLRYIKTSNGQESILAQFTNTSSDLVAIVTITDEKGNTILEEVPPGTLTKRYDMKTMQVGVEYKHFEEETLPLSDYIINQVKAKLKQFSIENGIIKIRTWDEKMACMCVRG